MTRLQIYKNILICVVFPITVCMTASCEDKPESKSASSDSAGTSNAKGKPLMSVGAIKPTNEMIKSLKLEGQSRAVEWGKIVKAGEGSNGTPKFDHMYQMLTTSANKDVWYVVGGNEVIGKASTELHIVLAGTELRIFDSESTSDHLIREHNFSERAARRGIRALKRENKAATFYNDIIEQNLSDPDVGILFEGRLFNPQTQQPEGYFTLSCSSDGKVMAAFITDENGASYLLGHLADLKLQPHIQKELSDLRKR